MPKGIPGSHPVCSVDGCHRRSVARGWCGMHYQRWSSWGDPLWTKRAEAERRFWDSVEKTEGCWVITGRYLSRGYGRFGRGTHGAHRFALEQALGRPLRPGMCALHVCDNRACVRNDEQGFYEVGGAMRLRRGHLFEGTPQENTADRRAKGRSAIGDRNGAVVHPETLSRGEHRYNARFTDDDIRVIRRRAAAGERPIDLAVEFGVWNTTIFKIVHRETWRHVV